MNEEPTQLDVKEKLTNLTMFDTPMQAEAQDWFRKRGQQGIQELEAGLDEESLGAVVHWHIMRLLAELNPQGSASNIVAVLERGLQKRNHTLISAGLETLSMLNHDAAANKLVELLSHPDMDIVREASTALGIMRPPQGVEPLIQMLQTDDAMTRYPIVDALLQYDNPKVNKTLRQHYETEISESIRKNIEQAGILEG